MEFAGAPLNGSNLNTTPFPPELRADCGALDGRHVAPFARLDVSSGKFPTDFEVVTEYAFVEVATILEDVTADRVSFALLGPNTSVCIVVAGETFDEDDVCSGDALDEDGGDENGDEVDEDFVVVSDVGLFFIGIGFVFLFTILICLGETLAITKNTWGSLVGQIGHCVLYISNEFSLVTSPELNFHSY